MTMPTVEDLKRRRIGEIDGEIRAYTRMADDLRRISKDHDDRVAELWVERGRIMSHLARLSEADRGTVRMEVEL